MLCQMWNDLGIYRSQCTKRFWIVIQEDFITSYLRISHLAVRILKISPQNTKWLMTARVKSHIRVHCQQRRRIQENEKKRWKSLKDFWHGTKQQRMKKKRLERAQCTVNTPLMFWKLFYFTKNNILVIIASFDASESGRCLMLRAFFSSFCSNKHTKWIINLYTLPNIILCRFQ